MKRLIHRPPSPPQVKTSSPAITAFTEWERTQKSAKIFVVVVFQKIVVLIMKTNCCLRIKTLENKPASIISIRRNLKHSEESEKRSNSEK
ncbi:hypothetical protein CEXT_59191 [Caerostris extrusa]|uniref:Uncharacterized protein n=1 Tax=Caerostris extrusa TaxID=172846 RepID=A0AAV4U5Q5_CAEEX|nr:hypothetical protein CEXT_59191 [Caerostris extrusa]